MPWQRLIKGLEEITGPPGTDGLTLDISRFGKIKTHLKSLGLGRFRARDIADGYLSLLPKSRRSGKGVYYTPNQIVEFILDEVFPKPINGKKKQDPYREGFRILEPACGAGYFLIASYRRLMAAYLNAGFKPQDAIRLVLTERLAGIDIDGDALLVTMAGLIQEAGDDLEKTLKKGPIILPLYKADFLDRGWEVTATPLGEILRSGIQAIVGNPPYVSFYAKRAKSITAEKKEYYKANYLMGRGRINTYTLFIERAFDLLKPSGVLGFIVPNTLLIMKSYEPVRDYLLANGWLKSIVDLSLKVFPEVEVPTCILTVEKKDARALPFPRKVRAGFWESARGRAPENLEENSQEDFRELPYTMFNIHIRHADRDIIDQIERSGKPLGEDYEVKDGINPANMSEKLVIKSPEKLNEPFKRVLRGRDIGPYQLNWDNFWVRYDSSFIDTDNGDYCFLRDERIFKANPKILTRQTADCIVAAYDDKCHYAMNTLHVTIPLNGGMDLKCLLALYNSRVLNYYYRLVFPDTERLFPQVKTVNVEKLPLPALNGKENRLVELADRLLSIRWDLSQMLKKGEKVLDEIDEVVYDLYGLSPKQVAKIEKSTNEWTRLSQSR